MSLIKITYRGRKFYKDRTTLKNDWQPGDTKSVTDAAAKVLLRYPEFTLALAKATGEQEQAEQDQGEAQAEQAAELDAAAKIQEAAEREQAEKVELDGMLHSIQAMNKKALEAYAQKYDTELKTGTLAEQRIEVNSLVHRFGVR